MEDGHGRRIDRLLGRLVRFCYRQRWLVLAIAVVITAGAVGLMSTLSVEMTWLDMVPQKHPSVAEFREITTEFKAATTVVLALEGSDPQRLREVAEIAADRLSTLPEYVSRVDVGLDREFFENYGLMLEKADDLEDLRDIFASFDLAPFLAAINESFEESYIGGEDSLEEDELRLTANVNGLLGLIDDLEDAVREDPDVSAGVRAAARYFDEGRYSYSADRRLLLVAIWPTVPADDIAGIGKLVPRLRSLTAALGAEHPDVAFRMTGMHVIAQDEMETASSDSFVLTNFAFLVILLTFVVMFRMWGAPLLAMLTLTVGIIWDLGIMALIVGRINLMTAMMAVILLGLGVDYFIHILSGFGEGTDQGLAAEEALTYGVEKVGRGVLIGSITTAIAFLVLALVDMQVFRELGLVLSVGILATMTSSFTVLPAALGFYEGLRSARLPVWLQWTLRVLAVITVIPGLLILTERVASRVLGSGRNRIFRWWGGVIQSRPWVAVVAVIVACAVSVLFLGGNWFDQNLLNMEMKGLESVELQRRIIRDFGLSESAVVVASDSLSEAQTLYDRLDSSTLVGRIDSLVAYVPSSDRQMDRLPYLAAVKESAGAYTPASSVDGAALGDELERLILNLREISEMATIGGQALLEKRLEQLLSNEEQSILALATQVRRPQTHAALQAFQHGFGVEMAGRVARMAPEAPVTEGDLPPSLVSRYRSARGKYLTSVYSRSDIWNRVTDSPFLRLMQSEAPETTGMPVFMKVLIEDSARYGRTALLIALGAIIVLVLLDFRSPWLTVLALSPLALGSLIMMGIMGLARYPFNIMMVTALPMILGIGIDDGVHLLHRYRVEDGDFPKILAGVGRALFLTTFTTMIAFGSLIFAKMQAYVGFGLLLFIGLGCIYLVTITFVPAVLRIVERSRS
jgi:predicted RND superfamily exporter protein